MFFDTCVICTLTALVLLVTGVAGQTPVGNMPEDAGLALAGTAFADVFGAYGRVFIAFAVTFFAFSSILGWSFYGMRAWEYLFGEKSTGLYRILFAAAALPGRAVERGYGAADIRCFQRLHGASQPYRTFGLVGRCGGLDAGSTTE